MDPENTRPGDVEPLDEPMDEQETGAGRPGPADEAMSALDMRERPVAGEPGPADEANAALDSHPKPVAGGRGPADEVPPPKETGEA